MKAAFTDLILPLHHHPACKFPTKKIKDLVLVVNRNSLVILKHLIKVVSY